MTITVKLPWPPSVNGYWVRARPNGRVGGMMLSERGREFRRAAALILNGSGALNYTTGVKVHMDMYPPNRARRDIDNHRKAVYDALTHAEIIRDDSDIKEDSARMHAPEEPGYVIVTIQAIAGSKEAA